MLDYDKRMSDAWDRIPAHRQKKILKELEYISARQQFKKDKKEGKIVWMDNYLGILLDAMAFIAIKLGVLKPDGK